MCSGETWLLTEPVGVAALVDVLFYSAAAMDAVGSCDAIRENNFINDLAEYPFALLQITDLLIYDSGRCARAG